MTTVVRSRFLVPALLLGLTACVPDGIPEYPQQVNGGHASGGASGSGSGGSGEGGASGSGGDQSTGGSEGTGGVSGTGGRATGGTTGRGGSSGSGGAIASGGSSGAGGQVGTGGSVGSGGSSTAKDAGVDVKVGAGGNVGSGGSSTAKDAGAGDAGSTVSYANQVRIFLDDNCTICHGSKNPSAGLDFTTYDKVKTNAKRMNSEIQANAMPPGGGLEAADKQMFQNWVNAGTPNN